MGKKTGLDWDSITANYVANGGELRPEVWDPNHTPAPKQTTRRRNNAGQWHAKGQGRRLTEPEWQDAIHRYQNGESPTEIGRRFGVSTNSVRRMLKRRGVPLRGLSEAAYTWRGRK